MIDNLIEQRNSYNSAIVRIAKAERENSIKLDLSGLGLTELPSAIRRLTNLQVLNLGMRFDRNNGRQSFESNQLTAIPDFLRELIQLQELYLYSNQLTDVPDWLSELNQLQILELGNNQLTTVPNALRGMTQLQMLDIGENQLMHIPQWIGELTQLQTLHIGDIGYNLLTVTPEWMGELTQLQNLYFYDNELATIPDWLRELTQLQNLYLFDNRLTGVPSWLSELTQIQSLILLGNELTDIPDSVSQLNQLQTLDLSQNELTVIPDSIGQLNRLETLDLGHNQLISIPDSLGKLTQLQTLGLEGNKLTVVPDWLGELTQIKILYLYDNQLDTIPDWLVEMPQLKVLYIYGNIITQPPKEQLGTALTDFNSVNLESVRRYYTQLRREGQAFFYEAKLLLIGEGGTGKTSLARKLIDPSATLPLPNESTEGIDVLEWKFPIPLNKLNDHQSTSPSYQVNIWDFGGQSIYFATHQFFLSKSSVYVLLADTRRQETDFYDWLRVQEAFGENSPILLLKNKNRERGNQFVIENLIHLCKQFPNLDEIVEVNLKNVPDDDGWPKTLRYLQKRLMALDHIGVPRPRTWVAVRQALNEDNRDSISRRQFLDLCKEYGITNKKDALQLSDYLHRVGDILHFEEDAILMDLVILKPTWALDAVYRVLDNQEIAFNMGEFNHQQLRGLWYEAKYDNHHVHLLRLMEKFKLCYPLRDLKDRFIAPQLLKTEAPVYEWDGGTDDLQMRYSYPVFMPRGILSRVIVALHHRIEDQELAWRSGVILCDEYARAELLELRGEKEIRIRVTGGNKRDLLMEIVRALDDLHRGFSRKLQVERMVPCRCEACLQQKEPHFFSIEDLNAYRAEGLMMIRCGKRPFKEVDVRSLIDDAVQLEQRGGQIYVGGDYINVGDIKDTRGIALGRGARGSVNDSSD